MNFTDCIYEIYKVTKTRRETDYPECDIGTGFSMFLGDVKNGAATPDNTGGILPDFDFAAAKTAWDGMTDEEKDAALAEIAKVRRNPQLLAELDGLYPDRMAMVEAVEAFLETAAELEFPEAEA